MIPTMNIVAWSRVVPWVEMRQVVEFQVDSPWFSGRAEVATFSREEMLATKLRALLQRNKGRDLYDLAHALKVLEGLSASRVVECLGLYLEKTGLRISRAEAEERMFTKLRKPALRIIGSRTPGVRPGK